MKKKMNESGEMAQWVTAFAAFAEYPCWVLDIQGSSRASVAPVPGDLMRFTGQ